MCAQVPQLYLNSLQTTVGGPAASYADLQPEHGMHVNPFLQTTSSLPVPIDQDDVVSTLTCL